MIAPRPLSVLFLGGSGIISAHVTRQAAAHGHAVTVANRGSDRRRSLPEQVERIALDLADEESVAAALGDRRFDCVVSWLTFTAADAARDMRLFAGRAEQFVFVSSASAYQTPPARLPVTESTPLRNPYWQYSRDKIAAENVFLEAYREHGFPVTIVRPSHTYDETMLPFDAGWTVVERMRRGKAVVVPGDGTSLWTITHSRDFAVGMAGLLGESRAVGEAFHITGDEAPTWNRIYLEIARAAGVERPRLVHVASETIAAADAEWGAALLGDKANSMLFDNAKIRSLVPAFSQQTSFRQGAAEIVAWHDADPARQCSDPRWHQLMDQIIDQNRGT